MHLISLDELDGNALSPILAGEATPGAPPRPLIALLDFLPLGPEGLALRAAVVRLGGQLVEGARLFPGFPDRTDLLESARAVGAYADALVIRHPLRGAARAAAAVSSAPVLSAGDGAGEDPFFAVGDLAALAVRLGGLPGKTVALCGDLRRNRRVHALAGGLLAADARVLLVPARGAEPAEGFLDHLAARFGYHPVGFEAKSMSTLLDMVDSWLLTPDLDHQLSLFTDLVATSDRERRAVRHQVRAVDALWVGSARDERGEPEPGAGAGPGRDLLPWRDPDGRDFVSPSTPREEAIDWDGRAPGEVGALSALLSRSLAGPRGPLPLPEGAYTAVEGIRCEDPACVACREPARVSPFFRVVRTDPVLLSCAYCWRRRKARFVGSRLERKFHGLTSSQVKKILPRNTVFFESSEQAAAAGFVASRI